MQRLSLLQHTLRAPACLGNASVSTTCAGSVRICRRDRQGQGDSAQSSPLQFICPETPSGFVHHWYVKRDFAACFMHFSGANHIFFCRHVPRGRARSSPAPARAPADEEYGRQFLSLARCDGRGQGFSHPATCHLLLLTTLLPHSHFLVGWCLGVLVCEVFELGFSCVGFWSLRSSCLGLRVEGVGFRCVCLVGGEVAVVLLCHHHSEHLVLVPIQKSCSNQATSTP